MNIRGMGEKRNIFIRADVLLCIPDEIMAIKGNSMQLSEFTSNFPIFLFCEVIIKLRLLSRTADLLFSAFLFKFNHMIMHLYIFSNHLFILFHIYV